MSGSPQKPSRSTVKPCKQHATPIVMDKQAVIRRVRIAWTAFWAILAVSFVFMWIRGYWAADSMSLNTSGKSYDVQSVRSMIVLKYYNPKSSNTRARLSATRFHVRSTPLGSDYNHIFQDARKTLGFLYSDSKAQYFVVPYRFPTLVSAALAALPWVKRKFSLRTMLIATTLLAVVLGLAVWAAR